MSRRDTTPIRVLVVLALVVLGAIASSVLPVTAGGKFLKKSAYQRGEGIYSTFKDAAQQTPGVGPMGEGPLDLNQLATLATLKVPVGRYAIFAKAWVQQQMGATQHVHCTLVAGGDFDHNRTQTGQFDASLSLEVVHGFDEPGIVTLRCADDGAAGNTDARVQWLKIIAIRAPSLSNAASE